MFKKLLYFPALDFVDVSSFEKEERIATSLPPKILFIVNKILSLFNK